MELRKFIATTIREYLNENYINDIWFHGSDTKNPKFGYDITPIFFTKSKDYAKGYGKFVNSYKLNIKNPLDTRKQDDLIFYNELFIPWAKEYSENDKRYQPLNNGDVVPMTTADLLYLFLRKSKREGLNHNYDGVLVDELGFEFDNKLGKYSIFPLSYSQIKNLSEK